MAGRRTKPKVAISSDQSAMRVPRTKIAALVAFVVSKEKASVAEVDVAVVGTEEMARLNRKYLGHPWETDVLSFDLSDSTTEGMVAQIVVCGDIAVTVAEAACRGLGAQGELMLYIVHGLLHLMGYEDGSAEAAARMHAREDELLAAFFKKRAKKHAKKCAKKCAKKRR